MYELVHDVSAPRVSSIGIGVLGPRGLFLRAMVSSPPLPVLPATHPTFVPCLSNGPRIPWEDWHTKPVVFTMLDYAYVFFLQDWHARLDSFGFANQFVLACGDVDAVGFEALGIGLACVAPSQREYAPFEQSRAFDQLGRKNGQTDLLVWRTAAWALQSLGSGARVMF